MVFEKKSTLPRGGNYGFRGLLKAWFGAADDPLGEKLRSRGRKWDYTVGRPKKKLIRVDNREPWA